MNAYIITGTSKGLGKAIVEEIIASQKQPILYCISRSVHEGILDLAAEKDLDLEYVTYDLSDLMGIREIMEDIMSGLEERLEELDGLYLVNNAGVIGPVHTIDHCKAEDVINNVHVNLLAPMLLASAFIHFSKRMAIEKRILNISSGAADHGIYGWSAYGASKAGLNLFTETVGVEQSYQDHGVKILSLAPGIVDTDMQGEIRASKPKAFRDVDRFIAFHENGDLVHPEVVAKDIVRLLHHRNYTSGDRLDIRHMEEYLNKDKVT